MEGAEPKMPGAPSGIQIMTPQQFVAKAGDMPGQSDWRDMTYNPSKGPKFSEKLDKMKEDDEQGVAEGGYPEVDHMPGKRGIGLDSAKPRDTYVATFHASKEKEAQEFAKKNGHIVKKHVYPKSANNSQPYEFQVHKNEQGVAEGLGKDIKRLATGKDVKSRAGQEIAKSQDASMKGDTKTSKKHFDRYDKLDKLANKTPNKKSSRWNHNDISDVIGDMFDEGKGVAESLEQLNRIRKLSGLEEATTLPASTRDLKGQEFQDYMNRIKGTDDIDKKTGQVKLDKKGNEKYVSGKTKSDKYKMPYIHRSSIIEYLGPDGKTYDEDKIKQSLSQRPKSLLKQNEKMKHSNGEFEQFFNVGFAALTGIAVDEQTNNLIIVNTCPGAGSCKVDCFAMKGGKVQFKAAWQSDGRILTYLLNDPDGFFNQLSAEISKEEQLGQKGDKKFPNGWKTTIRWHDAGDFFSPEYLDLALKMAAKHPDTKFYAYTKMAGAALAQKPPNFIINWSEGANTSQEKQVKAKDANLDTTKNSRIVPDDLFQDLLVKDEKKNLVKGASGQWQVQPDKLPELKQRLASEYGLSANSILSYDEYMAKRKSIPAGMKYNVIVAPGEGDISANDQNIISTLLLRH